MRNIITLCLIFTPLFITSAFAQTSIKSEVDKTVLTTDEVITYKLIITSSEKSIPEPGITDFTGFNVISSAQSSTALFTTGTIKTIIVYVFVLAPTGIGKFKIEPSTIKIKNETLSTDAFEIEVKQGKPEPEAGPRQKPPVIPEFPPEETEESQQITL
ncbi:MAG: BatD family protein [Candidatus Omnitrophota bacterium]